MSDITEMLNYISPSSCSYQEWINVGMALKQEGFSCDVWDSWSRADSRYHSGECEKKWKTFNGNAEPVTAGTIVQLAKERGWVPPVGHELGWDDEITADDGTIVNNSWLEEREVFIPDNWEPAKQIIKYLETLFDSSDNVGYVTETWKKDEKYMPTKGCYDRTAGELIQQLNKCEGDVGSVLGDYNEEAGAWIRFNPLDGNGVKNENVTEFRYALVECDNMEISKQNAIIRELELPVAALVHSGGKSIHAIVKINAIDLREYKQRVEFLYSICQKNGLQLDTQNKNPSRLSRLPGVMRKGQKQYLIDTNIGKTDFLEWKEWIESVNDSLPDLENLTTVWDSLPELSPSLIDGILRQGHKMLVAGPSKAGKSYALIELCCAIAEGKKWLGFDCTQGKVLYVNLELDRASCLHRFKDVYEALKWKPESLGNIDIWNLRGNSIPMDKLVPKLIRRAEKKNYIAVIIDPIYKIITGDENSAEQMSHFCNQFDKVCNELNCAVIYCHHHSKGGQGGKKSMDRASGSGVFARDPDALIDFIELDLTDELVRQQSDVATCNVCVDYLNRFGYSDSFSQDEACSADKIMAIAHRKLADNTYKRVVEDCEAAKKAVISRTAWRIEGTLREYPKFAPINCWFNYPIHISDKTEILTDLQLNSKNSDYKSNFSRKKTTQQRKSERKESLDMAFQMCKSENGTAQLSEIAEYLGVTEKTVKNHIKEIKSYTTDNGVVKKNKVEKVE